MTHLYLCLFLFGEVKVGHILNMASDKDVCTFGRPPAAPLIEHTNISFHIMANLSSISY